MLKIPDIVKATNVKLLKLLKNDLEQLQPRRKTAYLTDIYD